MSRRPGPPSEPRLPGAASGGQRRTGRLTTTATMNKSKSPSVAVIGAGYWGKNLVRNMAELNALAAVVDVRRAVAAKVAAAHGVAALSFDEVLERGDISGVVIASPAGEHYGLARAALAANKHALVEKPLALDFDEARELCRLADERHLTLMVGDLLQYHPAFIKLCDMTSRGELGQLRYLYSNRLNLGRIRSEESSLWSFAPHDVSMILTLAGEEPRIVTATGGNYLNDRIADRSVINMSFSRGVQAHVFVSWLHPFKEQKLVVVGERGMAVFNDGEPWRRKLMLYRHSVEWRNGMFESDEVKPKYVEVAEGEPLKHECRHFLACIATGERPRTDGRTGLRTLKVLQRAQEDLDFAAGRDGVAGASLQEGRMA